MNEETDHDKVVRLEEKLLAAAEALKLANANNHAVRAEVISIMAIAVSLYAIMHK
jgi:hypothetical protein